MFITRECDYAVRVIRALAGESRPEEITLYDIYSAVDPELLIIECMGQGYECVRNGKSDGQCMVHCELEEIQKELWKLLKRKNMKELLGEE